MHHKFCCCGQVLVPLQYALHSLRLIALSTPEEKARQNIDQQLKSCGWKVQDIADMNIMAGPGVAVREFPLTTGEATDAQLDEIEAKQVRAALLPFLWPQLCEILLRPERSANPGVEPASELLARERRERRQRWEQQLATYESKGKKPPKTWQSKYKEPAAPDTTNPLELPNGWCWTTIDAVGEVVGGITKGQKRKTEEELVEVPYLRVANVQRGYLDLSKIKTIQSRASELERYRLQPGDILFNEGGDRDKLGRGWVWEGQIEDCIHQNHVFRVRFVLPEMNSEFLSHHGNTFGRLWFLRTGMQSVNLASINMTVLRKFPVPLAPLSEQSAIIDFTREKLSNINRILELIEKNLSRSDRLRQTILKSAFEGSLLNHTAVQTEKELNACST